MRLTKQKKRVIKTVVAVVVSLSIIAINGCIKSKNYYEKTARVYSVNGSLKIVEDTSEQVFDYVGNKKDGDEILLTMDSNGTDFVEDDILISYK